ncbi:hypothetical protein [Sphingomonas sp. 37zxx]|uniref:hypothetical protein n=1 Tax=Sphingomonas sp. 37zxx TaxID=1550073 RepID=UPI00053BF996|nr:hypothetical protein [Sphingomonas sp. 37zxx]
MTMHRVIDHTAVLPGTAQLLTVSARCWRGARDCGVPVQPRLHAMLGEHGCGMLAPVIDSLMTLYQVALGRAMVVGAGTDVSRDERELIGLIERDRPRSACMDCTEGAGHALDCAICCTRIMIALSLRTPIAGALQ